MENNVASSIFLWFDLLLDLPPFLVFFFLIIILFWFFFLMAVSMFLQSQQCWPLKQRIMLRI